MRIGYLYDNPAQGYRGGAELDAEALMDAAPDWAELVICSGNDLPDDAEGWIIHNCVQSNRDIIPLLQGRPIVKRVHDVWLDGDPQLKKWLLYSATLTIMSSPLHEQSVSWKAQGETAILASAMNLAPFVEAAKKAKGRKGVIWLGRLFAGKGLKNAHDWATAQGVTVDVYGYGDMAHGLPPTLKYCGPLTPARVPSKLAEYERFLFLPAAIEPFGRTVVEAYAAGCELAVNEHIGALWWIRKAPKVLGNGAAMFWGKCTEVFGA
jgi:hypothetical protein